MATGRTRKGALRQARRPSENFIYPVKINRTGRRIGWFQSVTTGSSHPFHSMNEFAWLHLLDALPGVKDFAAQAERVTISSGNVSQRYTPDTRVVLMNGSVIYIEVKPLKVVETDEFKQFLELVQPTFRSMGSELRVVTDGVVKNVVVWENLREIHRQRHLVPDEGVAFQLHERLETAGPMHLGDLLQYHRDDAYIRQTILSLILRKRLSTDFTIPIDDDAVVFIPAPDFNPFSSETQ